MTQIIYGACYWLIISQNLKMSCERLEYQYLLLEFEFDEIISRYNRNENIFICWNRGLTQNIMNKTKLYGLNLINIMKNLLV